MSGARASSSRGCLAFRGLRKCGSELILISRAEPSDPISAIQSYARPRSQLRLDPSQAELHERYRPDYAERGRIVTGVFSIEPGHCRDRMHWYDRRRNET